MPDAYIHNTEVTVAGTTFARTLEFINGYSVEFENLSYSVRLAGSNNNIFDVENGILVQNLVQVIAQNSGGLIVSSGGGGGLTPAETADAVWEAAVTAYTDPATMGGKILEDLASILTAVSAGGALTPAQDTRLEEIWQILGLDIANPLIVSKIARQAAAVEQTVEENVPAAGSVKVTRQ